MWRESVDGWSYGRSAAKGLISRARPLDAALLVVDELTAEREDAAIVVSPQPLDCSDVARLEEPCQPGRLASGRNNHDVGTIGVVPMSEQSRIRRVGSGRGRLPSLQNCWTETP